MRTVKQMLESLKSRLAEDGEDAGDIRIRQDRTLHPSVDMDKRLVQGIITTMTVDNDGEVVVPKGLDTTYFPNQVKTVYMFHDYDRPIGKCAKLDVRKSGIYAQTYITTTGMGDEVLTMLNEGVINGFSIGFRTVKYGEPTDREKAEFGDECHTVHREGKLFEYSITPMPCNPDALVSMVSKGKVRRATAVAVGLPDTPERKWWPVVMEDGSCVRLSRKPGR